MHTPKGDKIRPTIDRVREAIFNLIAAEVSGSTVLDLFAGTGAMGLEALSRGASVAVFVDQSVDAIRLIRENIALCNAGPNSRVYKEPVSSAIRRLGSSNERFNLIFMDPPYGKGYIERILPALDDVAEEDSLVIAEHHIKEPSPDTSGAWRKNRERKYGNTLVSIYNREKSI